MRWHAKLTLALVLLTSTLTGRALAFGDCNNSGYLATFDERLRPGDCDVIDTIPIRWGTRSVEMRLIKMRRDHMGTAEQADVAHKARELATALGRAMSQIGNLDIAPVTLLFTDLRPLEGEDAHADIPHVPGIARECGVAFYKSHAGLTLDEFVFIYAHELFHCIEFKTWLDQMSPRDGRWWIEGTAEYFANLAVPGSTGSDGFVADFDSQSPTKSLIELSYENVAFFAWLTQASPTVLPGFIEHMPTAAGGQLAALQGVLLPDAWVEFEKAYLDGTIVLPGGRALPSHPNPGEIITISGTRSRVLHSKPFVVERARLTFVRGHNYELVFQDQPSDARVRWKDADTGAWVDPPAAVPACDIEMHKRLMWGTTASDDAGQMVVKVREGTADTCACVPGTWEVSSNSLETNVRALSPHDSCTLEGGSLRITFNADADSGGRATGVYGINGVAWNCEDPSSSSSRRTVVTGSDQISWASVRDVLFLGFVHPAQTIGTVHTVSRRRDGRSTTRDEPLIPARSALGPYLGGRYQCAGNRLHIDPPPGYPLTPAYSFDLTRVAPPAAH